MVISALIKSSVNPIQSSDIIANIHETRGKTGSQTPTKMTNKSYSNQKKSLDLCFDQYLIFLQVSSFGTGRVWAANCSFKAFFNQEFHILLQALEGKQTDKQTQHWPSATTSQSVTAEKKKRQGKQTDHAPE